MCVRQIKATQMWSAEYQCLEAINGLCEVTNKVNSLILQVNNNSCVQRVDIFLIITAKNYAVKSIGYQVAIHRAIPKYMDKLVHLFPPVAYHVKRKEPTKQLLESIKWLGDAPQDSWHADNHQFWSPSQPF